MHWILIWWLNFSSTGNVATSSATFADKPACEAALGAMNAEVPFGTYYLHGFCVPEATK